MKSNKQKQRRNNRKRRPRGKKHGQDMRPLRTDEFVRSLRDAENERRRRCLKFCAQLANPDPSAPLLPIVSHVTDDVSWMYQPVVKSKVLTITASGGSVYVGVNPLCLWSGCGAYNSVPIVHGALTGIPSTGSALGGTAIAAYWPDQVSLPGDAVVGDYEWLPLSAHVKVTPTAAPLNRSGSARLLAVKDEDYLNINICDTQFDGTPTCTLEQARDTVLVSWINQGAFHLSPNYDATAATVPPCRLGVIINGGGTGNTFNVEVVVKGFAFGRKVMGSLEPIVDPWTWKCIAGAIAKTRPTQTGRDSEAVEKGSVRSLVTTVRENMPSVETLAGLADMVARIAL